MSEPISKEYELIYGDGQKLDWDKKNAEYRDAYLEKIIMKEGKKTWEFTREDLNSEGIKGSSAPVFIGHKTSNALREAIYERLRSNHFNEVRILEVGLNDVYNKIPHYAKSVDSEVDSVKTK